MAVRIRLQRRGSKKRPFYAVVAADSRSPRDGSFLEKLGTHDPRNKVNGTQLVLDRIRHWMGHGALPTDTVARLLKKVEAAPASGGNA
ncbi:MAG: 30S ribosomal protein S16 [Magnetococcales bacterium]|nr:30S ribosomal protein S16 [Magnetococcales bacterium]